MRPAGSISALWTSYFKLPKVSWEMVRRTLHFPLLCVLLYVLYNVSRGYVSYQVDLPSLLHAQSRHIKPCPGGLRLGQTIGTREWERKK